MNLKVLEKNINYSFRDKSLLIEALTHPSMKKHKNYQRLEFLGNSILGAALADIIYNNFPNLKEGKLSLILSKMASTAGINLAITKLDLGQYMFLDRGEEKNSGRKNLKNLEDCCEGIIGAIYLDGGYIEARNFVEKFWSGSIRSTDNLTHRDPKSQLQEICQKYGYQLPVYSVVMVSGPVHSPKFIINCTVKTKSSIIESEVESTTKKSGEIESAKKTLELL